MEHPVARFYHNKHKQNLQERAQSPTLQIRTFNNFIKSVLISDALAGRRKCQVLDMCGGSGGDLGKYNFSDVADVTLVDVAHGAVQEAHRRYHEARRPPRFRAQFFCTNAFDFDVMSQEVLGREGRLRYDLVNCQFALHYAFECEQHMHGAMRVIAWALKPAGGRFVGIVPNAEAITAHISADQRVWRTDHFTVEYRDEHSYYFTMVDAVNRVPEYFIRYEALVHLADLYGLRITQWAPLSEVYGQSQPRHARLHARMNMSDEQMRSCTRDDFYRALVMEHQ